jgi:gliding motility-associated-like protein
VIPNGFSPNHDGINDHYVIIHPYNTIADLQVFNRWGNIVYKNTNYQNDWDGKGIGNFLGQDVLDGTYYYIIKVIDKSTQQTRQFVGYLTLKR